MSLESASVLISGGTRGIGREIALRLATDGANITMLAKTRESHPTLPGTLDSVAAEIEAAGGQALPVTGDVRNEDDIDRAVALAEMHFGGIDIVVNNASAIDLSGTLSLPMKKYDLMQDVNARGTFLLSRAALACLRRSDRAQILTLSPPLNLDPRWLGAHVAYTVSKYAMTVVTLGLAAEFADSGITANCLWPRTTIASAAVNLIGGQDMVSRSRSPRIMAEAAHAILSGAHPGSGRTWLDEEVLRAQGVEDFSGYRSCSEEELEIDIFVDA